jgi:hypothetical protein
MLIGRVRFILPLDQLKHLACIASPASALVVGPVLSRWIRLPSLRLPSFPGLPRPFHAFSSRFSSLSLCVYCFPPVLSFFFFLHKRPKAFTLYYCCCYMQAKLRLFMQFDSRFFVVICRVL